MTEYKCGSAKSCKYGDMCKPNFNIGACSHYKAEEPQTNEEWFNGLSMEEKAMAIVLCCPYEINWFGENFEKRIEQRMKNLLQSAQGYELGIQKIKKWLKRPHKGD